MKRLVILILAVVLMAGVTYAQDNVMTKKAGDYTVLAGFDKTPKAGDNTFLINIKDESGKAVTDATVKVHYYMREKAGPTGKYLTMTYMGSEAGAEATNTGYKANLNFSMSGPWNIEVTITRGGQEQTAGFFTLIK
ncbi:MAG: FixH family protein [Nitrospirae bacterium]|nr:FixH family protein [Nitrospirota bacterium]